MAQQFIKIFDDTVLKQSVNQGFEVQRTNTRLGQFTMGELAFTRDTARLFVGNFTNLDEKDDSGFVTGGSLTGNKYLGLIDSKPLTHWSYNMNNMGDSNSKTGVQFPLSYTENKTVEIKSTNAAGDIIKTPLEEKALLKNESKFRTDKNTGWSKEATYNEQYDAYNGDYVFDVFNNALIIFDNRIKPVSTTFKNWIFEDNKQKFINEEDGTYTETGNDYSLWRTPLINVDDNGEYTKLGNPKYPIYGDGYVVMRIIEPDGITLGYKEKEFRQDKEGFPPDDNFNYSHNYLELKSIPTDLLYSYFDVKFFNQADDGIITFGGLGDEINVSKINGERLTVPPVITVSSSPSPKTFNFNHSKTQNNTDKILCVESTGNSHDVKLLSAPKIEFHINDRIYEGVIHPGRTNIIKVENEIDIENTTHFKINDLFLTKNPTQVQTESESSNIYTGCNTLSSDGVLISTEEVVGFPENGEGEAEHTWSYFVLYDSSSNKSSYSSSIDEDGNITFSGKLAHPYLNMGLNYLKNPEPIAWGTGNCIAQFFLYPFVVNPPNYRNVSNNVTTIGKNFVTGTFPSGAYAPFIVKHDDGSEEETIPVFMQDNIGLLGARLPDHAKSIICELNIQPTSAYTLTTASDFSAYPSSAPSDSQMINLSSISVNTIPTTSLPKIKVLYSKAANSASPSRFVVEFPLYRSAEKMKFFSFAMNTTGKWVMRAIGYRS